LYTFEGTDFKNAQNKERIKIEDSLIDIGQRERKQQNYDIDNYYRKAFNTNGPLQPGKEKKKLKGWRSQANGGYDHQFFDFKRLD